jgi:hypothetical protein
MRSRRRDERGIALPTPVAALSLGAVLLAGIAFVSTSGAEEPPAEAARPVTATPAATPTSTAPARVIEEKKEKKEKKPKPKPKPEVRRGEVYVEVYNNSGITGLAGKTASSVSGAGWQVVGSDNWYGTIPASTVYYPERLETAARMLARDLGIQRLRPAISPMRFDRLTVILTNDFA